MEFVRRNQVVPLDPSPPFILPFDSRPPPLTRPSLTSESLWSHLRPCRCDIPRHEAGALALPLLSRYGAAVNLCEFCPFVSLLADSGA